MSVHKGMLFIVSALLFVGKILCVDEKCFQDFHGITNGCSVPIFKDFPYKVTFRPACQRHDLCYGCGVMYEKSKTYCDDQFLIDMRHICSKESFLQRLACKSWARTYYSAVNVGGKLFFKHNTDDGCSKAEWLKNCFV